MCHPFCRGARVLLGLQPVGGPSAINIPPKRGKSWRCKQFWAKDRQPDKEIHIKRLCGTEQDLFYCSDCKGGCRHLRYITWKTAARLVRGDGLKCLICNPETCTTSLERKVQNVLTRLFPNVEVFPQCRALLDFSGPVDFCLLFERVLVQVDGESHSEGLRYCKAQGVCQERIDGDCNTRATEQGWHMLRIHGDDVSNCAHVIQDVLRVAKVARVVDQGHRDCWMCSVTWSKPSGRPRELYIVKGGRAFLLTS